MSKPTLTGIPCLRCKRELLFVGHPPFRIGGTGGIGHLLLGNWADLGEATVELAVLACDTCGHVELQLPDRDREKLAQSRPS